MIKKVAHIIGYILAGLALLFQSCHKDLEAINVNPNASATIVPDYVFSKAELDAVGNIFIDAMGAMQYTTSYNDVAGFGSKYIFNQGAAPYTVFNNAYPNEINELGEVIRAVTNNPDDINKLAAARIWRVYSFHKITDLYGDVPYSEAGLGYTNGIYKPTYDAQEDIYKDMLKELAEAAASFDVSKPTFGAADVIYGGRIDKWKKFAYSLMLRLAMRLTKVDAALAEMWVKKAIAGGVITEENDIAMIKYASAGQVINQNPLAYSLLQSDYLLANGNTNPEGGKYQDTFIDYLKQNKDPRLGVVSVVYVNDKADTSAALQKGMPATFRNSKPADFVTYSEPAQHTVLQLDAPMLIMTNSEVDFLLAEAALRGWYSGQSAATLYTDGITAAMHQWALYGRAGEIPDAAINNYIAAHTLKTNGTFAEQMAQIHTQFWVAHLTDPGEAFSNWRRTGYPVLVPNNVPGNSTGGQIFRRMPYPPSEENLNKEAYQQAINRQGENTFLTRIWWDKA